MKVQCAWCKRWGSEKEPLSDKSVSHGICPKCEKLLVKKNPGFEWRIVVGKRHQPKVIIRDIGHLYQAIQREARAWRFLESVAGKEIESKGTFETKEEAQAAAALSATKYIVKHNPGESWHMGKMEEAERSEKAVKKESLKDFYHGKSIAHFESALEERAGKRVRKNPLAVFALGNPPKSVRAKVEGIIYRRCIEVKAEKTGEWERGFWKHSFSGKSSVHVLGLDNGDILLHSTAGIRLWKKA